MTLSAQIDLRIEFDMLYKSILGTRTIPDSSKKLYRKLLDNGTGNNQITSIFWSDFSATAAANSHELLATLTDAYGNTLDFTSIKLIAIINKSTTDTEDLSITGDFISQYWSGSIPVPAGGFWVQTNPYSGWTVSSGAETIQVDPGSDTIGYDLWLAGVA